MWKDNPCLLKSDKIQAEGGGYCLLLEITKKQIYPQVMEKGQGQNIDFAGGGKNHPLKRIHSV